MSVTKWRVMPIPEGDKNALKTLKPGASEEEAQKVAENVGGVTIFIGQGANQKQEFCRVGFIRRATKNPDIPFEQEFSKQLAAADALVTEVNSRLEAELPHIESELESLTSTLQQRAVQLSEEVAKVNNNINERVGQLGDRIDKLAGEIIGKVSNPEDLL